MARRWRNDRYPCFTQVVRHEVIEWHPTMSGVKLGTTPAIRAEFGVLGPEYQFEDAEGVVTTHAAISGGIYDLDIDAQEKGWTQEEQSLIEAKLDEMCKQPWCGIYRDTEPVVAAPWGTYDNIDAEKIPILASELGLVEQALAYEQATLNRKKVIADLQELTEQVALEEELTAT